MKDYILREYGSWAVFLISFVTGLIIARDFNPSIIYIFIALSLFVNSKQSMSIFLRRKSNVALIVFLFEILTGIFILFFLIETDRILLYGVIPLIYFLLFVFKGEHFFLTEIAGFGVLTLSSLLSYYVITGRFDNLLYLTTFIYFASGVFKVRIYLRRDILHRLFMFFYIAFVFLFSYLSRVNILIFSPLLENLVYALSLYKAKLSFIGWTEVFKGLLFILLMAGLYG